jgi:hypothetical protein
VVVVLCFQPQLKFKLIQKTLPTSLVISSFVQTSIMSIITNENTNNENTTTTDEPTKVEAVEEMMVKNY